ncbi:MAG: non-ribosomal peptide synthetase, partial [Blastocatellia bacterium AA13]
MDQLQPGSGAYNIPCAVRLKGELDVDALRKSLTEMVRRHEILRTNLAYVNGEPRQQVNESLDIPLTLIDLTHTDEFQREAQLREIVAAEARRGFDLVTGPMIRMKLVKVRDDSHVLILVMHHIVSDGWSIQVIVKEVSQLYAAFAADGQSRLPELPIQYADYAVWQRDWLTGDVLESRLEYWKRQFERAPKLLELPADRPRPSEASYRGASERWRLSEEMSAKLRDLSRREGVTLFMTLLAGFQLLLARYSGQCEIAVGTPVAGRDEVELEDLIGCFLNTLVIKVDVDEDLTVKQFLGRVRTTVLGALAHQDLPFDKMVEEIHPERTLSHQPLFQVWLVLQNVPPASVNLQKLSIEMFPIEDSFTKFDLMLSISDQARGLTGSLRYSTDLFEAGRIRRMLSHFTRVLEGMVEKEDGLVREVELISKAEREEMLVGWNQTGADYRRDRCVHELFEEQVEKRRDAVAVAYEGKRVSYGELNRRANQVGQYLIGRGVGADVKVGLCVERGIEMIVGL